MNREKIKQIVSEALDLQGDQRDPFIRQTCGDDQSLLAEVRSLLGAASNANEAGFLPSGAFGGNPTEPVTIEKVGNAGETISVPIGEKPGSVIGRYKLIEQIGEGGFGVVFKAEQGKPVRRTVALKIIKLGMDTREVVARFEAERQALAMMDHPNIAKVLDAGTTETGRPYFVMELVRGSPVTEYADKHKLPTRDRVALAAQICRAVQHAHSKGIIHRDLKPSNVLVTVTDDKPVPKVIDFGIAKATQSPLTERTLYTAHRQLIGTPQYMSPEQADSDGSDIDTRSDIYSLGVLLYELLVGTTPMDARQLRSAAYDAMRKMIRDTEVPRPATRLHTLASDTQSAIAASRSTDLKKLAESVKGELDWIVMKALEKDRTRRYETAAAMADDLNRYLLGEVVLAGPVSGTYRLQKALRRYKAAVLIGGTIAACLLLGVAGTTWGLVQATHQRDAAQAKQIEADLARAAAMGSEQKAVASAHEAERQKALAETEKKDALAQKSAADEKSAEAKATLDFFTNDILAKASPSNTKDDKISKVLVDALITPALKTIDKRFADQPLVRASIQYTLSITLLSLGRQDLALPQAKAAWDARRVGLGDDHPDTIRAMINFGIAVGSNDYPDPAKAADLLKQAWDRSQRVLGGDNPATIDAIQGYGAALAALGRYAESADVCKQAWDRSRRVLGDDDQRAISAMENYAYALQGLNRYAEMADVCKQAWERSRRVLGDDDPLSISALGTYGNALHSLSRYAEAGDIYKQAWERCCRVLGDFHPNTHRMLVNYTTALTDQGRYAEALDVTKQQWDRCRLAYGDGDDDNIALTEMRDYGSVLVIWGKNSQAEAIFRQMIEHLHRRKHFEQTMEYWQVLSVLGNCLETEKKWSEAESVIREQLDIAQKIPGPDSFPALDAMARYSLILSGMGRHAEAVDMCKRVWDGYRRRLGDDHRRTIGASSDYATRLLDAGRYADAAGTFKEAWDRSQRVLGADDTQTLLNLTNYGWALIEMGRYAEGADISKQAWDRYRRVLGGDALNTVCSLLNYCDALDGLGKCADAEPLLRQALESLHRTHPDHQYIRNALSSLGKCLAAQHKWSEAEPVLREDLAWDQSHPSPDQKPGSGPDSRNRLNQCLLAEGKPPEATTAPALASQLVKESNRADAAATRPDARPAPATTPAP